MSREFWSVRIYIGHTCTLMFMMIAAPMNLLALWSAKKTAFVNSRCNEFSGRKEFGNKAQLYKKFFEEKERR